MPKQPDGASGHTVTGLVASGLDCGAAPAHRHLDNEPGAPDDRDIDPTHAHETNGRSS